MVRCPFNDCDGQILYYRKDILNNPDYQTNPKKSMDTIIIFLLLKHGTNYTIFLNFSMVGTGIMMVEPDAGIVMHLKVGAQYVSLCFAICSFLYPSWFKGG